MRGLPIIRLMLIGLHRLQEMAQLPMPWPLPFRRQPLIGASSAILVFLMP